MGCVRELLNDRKTSDILKMFRMTSKVKTRDTSMPQYLHSCTCTSRAVSAGLPVSNMANRKSFSAKRAVPSPKANDSQPHLALLPELTEDVPLHRCPSWELPPHSWAHKRNPVSILSHFGQSWMS